MKRRVLYDKGSLAVELAGLPHLERSELIERWRALYSNVPPKNISRQLMVKAIAYKMQERVYGGLKPATKKFLAKSLEALKADKVKPAILPPALIKPGTRLIREWHGKTYEVEVIADGVLFNGKRYRSLSEVARIITGVKWSGPLFFGLKGRGV
ncbi:MAG TPA: DUF2924 domain-containing protein [Rickettsiales bacterium]|nr:DUF2924 domain-containing protein [Rickettsiales bacterium]